METKNNIFEEHAQEWLKAKGNKKKRREITDHVVFVTKMHPKSVPRKFKNIQLRDPAHRDKRGRPCYYDNAVSSALRDVWEAGDHVCGELLHPMIAEYITTLKRDGQWSHEDRVTEKLMAMSERTTKRRVTELREKDGVKKRGLSGTSPSALKNIIPIRKGPWKDTLPGDGQLDTVAHCGQSLVGSFIRTLNYTDMATYRTVIRAQWNKGQEATKENVISIRESIPFPLRALHPDSGGEFINWTMKEWCDQEKINLSRSEPYKKNDNMCVEERNGHVIRKYLGWERLDDRDVLPLVNELCGTVTICVNHWKAVKRMVSKKRIGAKYRRTYEKHAMTPYARVMAREDISLDAKERLRTEYKT